MKPRKPKSHFWNPLKRKRTKQMAMARAKQLAIAKARKAKEAKLTLPLNPIELPMDGEFKVILKIPHTMPHRVVASVIKQVRETKDARFLFLPENVKVIVIRKDGEAQVFGATII